MNLADEVPQDRERESEQREDSKGSSGSLRDQTEKFCSNCGLPKTPASPSPSEQSEEYEESKAEGVSDRKESIPRMLTSEEQAEPFDGGLELEEGKPRQGS